MAEYKLTKTSAVIRTRDAAFIPDDVGNKDRAEYEAWLVAGGVPDPLPAVSDVPVSVTPRQARLALHIYGLLTQVEEAVNAEGGTTQITWDYATYFDRNDPLIVTLGTALGLTSTQIDDLFRLAATL